MILLKAPLTLGLHDSSTSGHSEHYTHKDTLGSTDVITNAVGGVVAEMSFDAFGKRRNVLTLAALTQSQYIALNALTTQGFTGHEMVDEAGIIHMGGRIYDPGLGRFLSADPIVSDLGNVQRLNRYSYVLNSPLSYTDPTGFDQCHPDDSTCIFGTITVIGTSSGGVSSTMVFGQGSGNYFQSGSSSAGGPSNTPPAQSDPSVNGAATEEATPTPVAPPVSVVTKDGDPITTDTTPDVAIGTATATTQVIATAPPTVIPTTETSTDVMQTDMEVADVGGGWTGTLNAAQAALTGLGFAPVVGIGADLLNGLISVVRGDLFGASFSVLRALPIAGDALGAARLGIATKSIPTIKPGAAGGETAGKSFTRATRDAAKAENPAQFCVYCRREGVATQVDHAIPRARGGNATFENAQLACPHCNASKGARDYPVNPPPGYRGDWPPSDWEN